MVIVNRIIQFSSVYFYDTQSVYRIVCPPPKVKHHLPSSYLWPHLPSTTLAPPFPLVSVLLSVSLSETALKKKVC